MKNNMITPDLPNVFYSTKSYDDTPEGDEKGIPKSLINDLNNYQNYNTNNNQLNNMNPGNDNLNNNQIGSNKNMNAFNNVNSNNNNGVGYNNVNYNNNCNNMNFINNNCMGNINNNNNFNNINNNNFNNNCNNNFNNNFNYNFNNNCNNNFNNNCNNNFNNNCNSNFNNNCNNNNCNMNNNIKSSNYNYMLNYDQIPNQNNDNNNNNQKNNISPNNINQFPLLDNMRIFQIRSKIGLKKMEKSYCLNSILQCLGNIQDLAIYNLNPQISILFRNNVTPMLLSFAISILFFHFYSFNKENNETYYTPQAIIFSLEKLYENFLKINEKNPITLLKLILERLHIEYLQLKQQTPMENKGIIYNKYDKSSVINHEILNYDQNNKTYISLLFSWFELEKLQCLKCNNKFYQMQNNFTLDLNYFDNNDSFDINDCLNYYYKDTEKKLICDCCKKITKIKSNKQIYSSPNIFIFTLNFNINHSNKKFLIKNECIKLDNYIYEDNRKTYFLIGIVSFVPKENKFIAYFLSQKDNKWYCCDDENVNETNFPYIQKQNNVLFTNKAYILFYRAI